MPWFAQLFPEEWIKDGMSDPQRLTSDPALQVRARARFRKLFASRPSKDWERIINEELGVPSSACQSAEEWLLWDQHATDSRAVISCNDPELGRVAMAGYPFDMSLTPLEIKGPRRPVNSDRDALEGALRDGFERLGHVKEAPENCERELAQPLSGYRVVDLTQVLAGPTLSRILAQYGADVIKINSFDDLQLSGHFYTNNGKDSIFLNLKTTEGMEVLWRLVESADVFSQNFTRGVPERLGIDENTVRSHAPEIIYSSISAFGLEGRRAPYRGREELGQAVTGMQVRWGGFDSEPAHAHLAFTDFGTGQFAAIGVLAALLYRLRTGKGQAVHASLAQTATFLQVPFMVAYQGKVWDEPNGCSLPKGLGPLDRLYQAGDGAWFYLAAVGKDDRRNLEDVTGIGNLHEGTPQSLAQSLEACFVEATADVWVERLRKQGLAAQRVLCVEEVVESGEARARGLIVTERFRDVGLARTSAPSARLSLTPPTLGRPVGLPGSDGKKVLESIGLGDKFEEFCELGVMRGASSGIIEAR